MKWNDLTIKEKLSIITAFIAFGLGWILTICGFYVEPVGEVSDSVLFILGQALIYSASVFGIAAYFNSESKRLKNDINNMIEHRFNEDSEV